jgi:hypothetical protein
MLVVRFLTLPLLDLEGVDLPRVHAPFSRNPDPETRNPKP